MVMDVITEFGYEYRHVFAWVIFIIAAGIAQQKYDRDYGDALLGCQSRQEELIIVQTFTIRLYGTSIIFILNAIVYVLVVYL